jgi:DnaJ-class molecular chaperone
MATVHFRVRGVKCGKCAKIHYWYKYRVWREGKKIKEEYVGRCDAQGNMEFDHSQYTYHHTGQNRRQSPPPNQPSSRPRSPYEILGISYYATTEQIKKAYRALAKKYHPDVNKHADPRIITEINVAYRTLMMR